MSVEYADDCGDGVALVFEVFKGDHHVHRFIRDAGEPVDTRDGSME